jgi:glucokinase
MQAFLEKGRMRELLTSVPVRVIVNDKTALLGAARVARLGARQQTRGTYCALDE